MLGLRLASTPCENPCKIKHSSALLGGRAQRRTKRIWVMLGLRLASTPCENHSKIKHSSALQGGRAHVNRSLQISRVGVRRRCFSQNFQTFSICLIVLDIVLDNVSQHFQSFELCWSIVGFTTPPTPSPTPGLHVQESLHTQSVAPFSSPQ